MHSVGGAGQHRGMSQKPSREHSHAMQNEPPKSTTAGTFGRSSIDRLPAKLREAVDAAIADGATIDQITARIRAEGETCSRSAVGRYAKNMRDLIRQQQETDRTIKAWVDALGERPEGQAGLILIETLRTMVLATMARLSAREEPVSTEELARLALTLKRIEGTDKLRKDRERAAKKAAQGADRPRARAGSRRRPSPSSARRWRAGPRRRPAPSRRCRWTRGIPQSSPQYPANQSHLIPANPT